MRSENWFPSLNSSSPKMVGVEPLSQMVPKRTERVDLSEKCWSIFASTCVELKVLRIVWLKLFSPYRLPEVFCFGYRFISACPIGSISPGGIMLFSYAGRSSLSVPAAHGEFGFASSQTRKGS